MLTFGGAHCSSQVRNLHHVEIIPIGLIGTKGVLVDSLIVRTHLIQLTFKSQSQPILNYTYPREEREKTTWYNFIMTYKRKNSFTIHIKH